MLSIFIQKHVVKFISFKIVCMGTVPKSPDLIHPNQQDLV